MEWVFYILVYILPITETPKLEAKEPWAIFKTKTECDRWHEWWVHNNNWLQEFGVVATECERLKEEDNVSNK